MPKREGREQRSKEAETDCAWNHSGRVKNSPELLGWGVARAVRFFKARRRVPQVPMCSRGSEPLLRGNGRQSRRNKASHNVWTGEYFI